MFIIFISNWEYFRLSISKIKKNLLVKKTNARLYADLP